MTNEEKARKIIEQYETRYNDTRDLLWVDLEYIALQAMQWKDEQHKQEKQQFIEKACEWLKKNMIGLDMGKYPMYSPNFINDFRKVMEE